MKKTKKAIAIIMAATLMMGTSITSFAGNWQQNETGKWWQNDDGSYPANTWQWIDGNGDGVAECYYFNTEGYTVSGGFVPDGYQVNTDGAWIENGVVQTKAVNTNPTSSGVNNNEIAAAVARAKAAGAGSYQDKYISGGWKIYQNTEMNVRATKDENGMIVSPTSGIVYKFDAANKEWTFENAGSDKSITLATDPSNGNLQPNWLYNPLGKTMAPPAVICMDKNIYSYGTNWTLTATDYTTGEVKRRMDTVDTSGSWVYNPNPTGSANYSVLGGQLSGWMYRYADGTYAANGTAYIYDGGATWDSSANNLAGSFVTGQAYYFNENGFLVTNSARSATYVDEYGRECDGTAGPYGVNWYYDR